MELSIIISTYNNVTSLVRTLESVAKQDYDKKAWECVVVNNNSTDDTAERVSAFVEAHPELNIRVVEELCWVPLRLFGETSLLTVS